MVTLKQCVEVSYVTLWALWSFPTFPAEPDPSSLVAQKILRSWGSGIPGIPCSFMAGVDWRGFLLTINDGEVFKPCIIDKILIYEIWNAMSYVV